MVRVPCCERMGMKKGPWTAEEDHILISYIQSYGHDNWRALPKQAGLLRCGKSCRLRWINYLRPDIKRGNFTKDEKETIINLHRIIGNRWSAIATKLPGRTDNEIKNYWHTHLKKNVEEKSFAVSSKGLRISETWISSNNPAGNYFQNNGYYNSWAAAAKEISKENELILKKKLSDTAAEENYSDGKSDGQEFCLTNKSMESRAEVSSAGDSFVQSRDDDCINSDMDFWYNLFVNSGKSHDKVV